MTTPGSGPISIGNVSTELGASSTSNRSLGESSTRTLAGVPSGAISLYNLYGKSNVSNPIMSPQDSFRLASDVNWVFYLSASITGGTPSAYLWTCTGGWSVGGSTTANANFTSPNLAGGQDSYGDVVCRMTVNGTYYYAYGSVYYYRE